MEIFERNGQERKNFDYVMGLDCYEMLPLYTFHECFPYWKRYFCEAC